MLTPDDADSMIAEWRRLTALYREHGYPNRAVRTERLANQLAQIIAAEQITYTPDPKANDRREVSRYCRKCLRVRPRSKFGRDASKIDGYALDCRECLKRK